MVVSLDHLKEQSWSVFNWLGKDLQQVALVIVVNQDLQFLQLFDILCDLDASISKSLFQILIVGVWYSQELNTSVSHSANCGNDVISLHSNVLDSSTCIVVNILLDL